MTAFSQPIHVFVVAPVMLCWGFERLVNTGCPGIRISGSAPSLDEALTAVRRAPVDVLVVDNDDGFRPDTLADAAQLYPIVLLTSGDGHGVLAGIRGSGVTSAVRKRDAPSLLVSAIEAAWEVRARRGQRAQPWSHHPRGLDLGGDGVESRIESLTSRERQLIMVMMCSSSAPGKVVADRLGISEHTLRNHLTSIYAKLGVHSRLSLHAFATKHHLEADPHFFQAHNSPGGSVRRFAGSAEPATRAG